MRIVYFCHSLLSDWNHGNAHFLRGVVSELQERGHAVDVYEPQDAWSLQNLRTEHGDEPLERFHARYPTLGSNRYDLKTIDLEAELAGADVVIVHEWNDHSLVRRIGEHHARSDSYVLLFHDTHHRSITDRNSMAAYDLARYDGVLAFGRVIRDIYLSERWTHRAYTWHEAADTRVFHPQATAETEGDLVWIGNWGDDERTAELHEFLIEPVKDLRLKARIHGVRYPQHARDALAQAGIDYAGWLANFDVPEVFARYRVTVHVPRGPYVRALPGIPTIRPFEALACGIPLVSAWWDDCENLFTPGEDYLVARNGEQMGRHLRDLLADPGLARGLAERGRQTILARHTCAHRVDELLEILRELGVSTDVTRAEATLVEGAS